MGNYRFRLADMIPNVWFYKLKDMRSSRKHNPTQTTSNGLAPPPLDLHPSGVGLTTRNLDPPRRSYGNRSGRRRAVYRPSNSLRRRLASSANSGFSPGPGPGLSSPSIETDANTDTSTQTDVDSSGRESVEVEYMGSGGGLSSSSNSMNRKLSSPTTHIVIELDELCSTRITSAPKHPPLIPHQKLTPDVKILEEEHSNVKQPLGRKTSRANHGIKLRQNSPGIRRRKIRARHRKSFSSSSPSTSIALVRFANKNLGESLVMVKSSYDPQRDFRDSMAEMIMENKVQTSKDLEDLLACYLSLNSTHDHEHIVKAFEQIWVNLSVCML